MKTAISVPDETFRRVEQTAARLGMNRSEFFSTAAEHFLSDLEKASLVDEINAAVDRGGKRVQVESEEIGAIGAARLAAFAADDEW